MASAVEQSHPSPGLPNRRRSSNNEAGDRQRNRLSGEEDSNRPPSSSAFPGGGELRSTLFWLLKILIILFVLYHNLDQSSGQMAKSKNKGKGKKKSQTQISLELPAKPSNNLFIEKRDKFNTITYWENYENSNVQKKFDHFVLNMRWSVTKVAIEEKTKGRKTVVPNRMTYLDQPRFTIHGLWPSDSALKEEQPAYCFSRFQEYNFDVGVSGIKNIFYNWPGYGNRNDDRDFWIEEWNKHGRCAMVHKDLDTCLQYFKKTTSLAEELDGLQGKFRSEILGLRGAVEDTLHEYSEITFKSLSDFFEKGGHGWNDPVRINFQPATLRDGSEVNLLEGISFCWDVKFTRIGCPFIPVNQKSRDALYVPRKTGITGDWIMFIPERKKT